MKAIRLNLPLVFFALVLLFFTSCISLPSESEAKKQLEIYVSEASKGNIKLVEFEKTNGINQDILGQEIYTLEFNATVEVINDGYKEWEPDEFLFTFYEKPRGVFEFRIDKKVKKGEKFDLKGKIEYEKTENGWRGHKPHVKRRSSN